MVYAERQPSKSDAMLGRELTKPDETLSELEKRKDTLTWENGGKRYFKLLNRKRIKEANARKKGY